jgi:ABC-2 type transport system ATP-binding protein
LRRPAGGVLTVLGEDAAAGRAAIRRRTGFLPQQLAFPARFTVAEYLTYAAWLKAVPTAGIGPRVAQALDLVDLADRRDHRLKTLSGGMLRRAGIAQAIVHDPDLVVLDEPAAGLDPAQRVHLRDLIRVKAQAASVLISTHLVEDVVIADHVVVLNDGQAVFTGSVEELRVLGRAEDGVSELESAYGAVLARSLAVTGSAR